MIARAHKVPLRTLPDFFTTASRTGVRGLSCYWKQHNGLLQISAVVSKKTAPLATVRTATKRAVYALISAQAQELKLTELPIQVVVIVEQFFLRAEKADRTEVVRRLLRKIEHEYAQQKTK